MNNNITIEDILYRIKNNIVIRIGAYYKLGGELISYVKNNPSKHIKTFRYPFIKIRTNVIRHNIK